MVSCPRTPTCWTKTFPTPCSSQATPFSRRSSLRVTTPNPFFDFFLNCQIVYFSSSNSSSATYIFYPLTFHIPCPKLHSSQPYYFSLHNLLHVHHLQSLYAPPAHPPPGNLRRNVRRRPASVGTQFKISIGALINNLGAKTPHFVRCIKPNENRLSRQESFF